MDSATVNGEKWKDYGIAFDWFNHNLFKDELTPCYFFPSASVSEYGIFKPENCSTFPDRKVYAVGFNPQIENRPVLKILGYIVCQMIHQWHYEKNGSLTENYCGKIIINKYKEIGLLPLINSNDPSKKARMRVDFEIDTNGQFKKSAELLIVTEEAVKCNENFLSKIIFPEKITNNSLESSPKKATRLSDTIQQFICPNCNFRVYVEYKAPSWCPNCAPQLPAEFMDKVFYFQKV